MSLDSRELPKDSLQAALAQARKIHESAAAGLTDAALAKAIRDDIETHVNCLCLGEENEHEGLQDGCIYKIVAQRLESAEAPKGTPDALEVYAAASEIEEIGTDGLSTDYIVGLLRKCADALAFRERRTSQALRSIKPDEIESISRAIVGSSWGKGDYEAVGEAFRRHGFAVDLT